MINKFHVYDSHTAGTPTRVMVDGIPPLEGKSVAERKQFLKERYDFIRTTLMQEPRGNSGVAALVIPPSNPAADFGLIFSDFRGYVDMCIHGTIGVATTLIEYGLVKEDVIQKGEIMFDTPAGLVKARAKLRSPDTRTVEFVTVASAPSFFVNTVELKLQEMDLVKASIAFGGNFYAYVNAPDLGLQLASSNLSQILRVASELLKELRAVDVVHPEIKSIRGVLGVSLFEDLDRLSTRNIMVAENDLFDRSPCGTGTCGRMAVLHASGKMSTTDEFESQSIIGTKFVGKIKDSTKVGQFSAILPEITGRAYLTGISDLMVSEEDPLGSGFIVG